jgi:transposase-like protein
MVVIWDFNITLENYVQRGIHNEFPEMEQCPHCKARTRLRRHGFYFRNAVEEERTYRIPICRLQCSSCRKTVSLLPDFLLPYYQHTLQTVMTRLKEKLIEGKTGGAHQLIQFYLKRFMSQLTYVEMFFRDQGWREYSPPGIKEKAIRLLKMIQAFGEAPFVRRSRGHFTGNFMAHSLYHG